MNIAIVGRGFAGLGLAFHFFKLDPNTQITFFDKQDLLSSASANSTGLFNYFVGKSSKKNPHGEEAFSYSLQIIQAMEKFSGLCLSKKTGLLKLASTQEQQQEFAQAAEKYGIRFLEKEAISKFNSDLKPLNALYIDQAFTVKPRKYLQTLWDYCKTKGAKLISKTIQNVKELEEFDAAILACGASKLLDPFSLPVDSIKGQMLVCKDKTSTFSKMPINSKGHVTFYDEMCFLGSTYERKFLHEKPDLPKALTMKEDIEAFYPPAKDLEILECRAGMRLSRKNSPLPIVGHLDKNVWALTALGSRGLLYHGFFSKLLAEAVLVEAIDQKIDKVSVECFLK